MNAREVRLGSLFFVLGVLSPFSVADAQCMRDVFLVLGTSTSTKDPSKQPSEKTPLSSGDKPATEQLQAGSDPGVALLGEAQILALPVKLIVTETDWTPRSRFEGPLLRDVLELRPGASGGLNVYALNQYAVSIPMSDLDKYSPILAHTRDGVRLKRSDFGPLFVVYPRDQFAELRTSKMAARMAWQVCRIDVG